MKIVAGAPFVLAVNVRSYLDGNTHAIEGSFRISDRADRTIREGTLQASNAGALIRSSDEELMTEAAGDVVRMLVPVRGRGAVLVPKGQMDSLIPLAEKETGSYLAVERLPRLRRCGRSQDCTPVARGAAYQCRSHRRFDISTSVVRNIAAARKPDETIGTVFAIHPASPPPPSRKDALTPLH
jgi:hypothetical protein